LSRPLSVSRHDVKAGDVGRRTGPDRSGGGLGARARRAPGKTRRFPRRSSRRIRAFGTTRRRAEARSRNRRKSCDTDISSISYPWCYAPQDMKMPHHQRTELGSRAKAEVLPQMIRRCARRRTIGAKNPPRMARPPPGATNPPGNPRPRPRDRTSATGSLAGNQRASNADSGPAVSPTVSVHAIPSRSASSAAIARMQPAHAYRTDPEPGPRRRSTAL